MDMTDWLAAKVYTQSQVLRGLIYHPYLDRLLDRLNTTSISGLQMQGTRFLVLRDVTIKNVGEQEEKVKSLYIMRDNIFFVTTDDADAGRGLGAKPQPIPYPFVNKRLVPVTIYMTGYIITGHLHYTISEEFAHLIDQPSNFLPVTDADIVIPASGGYSKVRFAAVNREHISSLQETGIHLEAQPPSSTS